MTGLPLDRPLDANQTEIANSTATSGPPVPTIDYYQRVMSSYFETVGIPILQGRGFQSTDEKEGGPARLLQQEGLAFCRQIQLIRRQQLRD